MLYKVGLCYPCWFLVAKIKACQFYCFPENENLMFSKIRNLTLLFLKHHFCHAEIVKVFVVVIVDMSTATPLSSGKDEESEKKDEMDDDTMFTSLGEEDKSKPFVAPRWATRVFAADCLCRIINLCENADQAHFDLAMARSAKLRNPTSKFKSALLSPECVYRMRSCAALQPA